MAKTLTNIKRRYIDKKIMNVRYSIEFNKNYAHVQIERLNEKNRKKLAKLEVNQQKELLIYKSQTLDEKTYISYHTEHQIQKLHHKLHWKKLAIKQSISRMKNTDEIKVLIEKERIEQAQQWLEQSINKLKEKALGNFQKSSHLSLETYQTYESDFKRTYQSLKETLEKELESKSQIIQSKARDKDQLLNKKLSELIEIMKDLVDESAFVDFKQDTLLSIRNLTMQFGGLKAVNDLSFDVKQGEIFGLIGPNGAGKTTVFNCITQFYKPTQGQMIYRNKANDIVILNEKKVHDVIKHGIVRTFQNVELIWELSVLDNLLVGGHSIYRSNFFDHSIHSYRYRREQAVIKAKALDVLKSLDLLPYQYAYPYGLPYGILKRIELARTLMTNPKLIILDEPAAGLNEMETKTLSDVIRRIRKDFNCTIFLVEHDMGLVMDICDRICAISFGKMLAIGTPAEIQKDPVVQEAYLGGS